jgi:micrococcal nuclease
LVTVNGDKLIDCGRTGFYELNKLYIISLLLFSLFLILSASERLILTGKVVGISDGDTFALLQGSERITIRLHGIDCPEKNQSFGQNAKMYTSSKIFGKEVVVTALDKDRYGRIVGDVTIGGANLNYELVRKGYAWWNRKYAPHDDSLRILEETARKHRLGLWSEVTTVEPWTFRRNQERSDTLSR